MKPIPSPVGRDALHMLNKAQQLLEKAEKLEMVEHDGKKVPSFAADGEGDKDLKEAADMAEKDKYCMKNFGKKYSECSEKEKAQCDKVHGKVEKGEKCPECNEKMNKMGCAKMGCKMNGKMQKSAEAGAQPGFTTSFDSNPGNVMFLAESGGQTRSAYYTTNQYPYNGEDVANKGSTSESVNIDALSPKMNPHDGGGADRQVENGVLSKAQAALAKAKEDVLKAVCRQCGGNQFSGCKLGFGDDCPGLEGTTEVGEMVDDDRYDPSEYMRHRY
tara:strand:- start:298 stop:1116 length:819 start_codon:yes stop_codon:yes gene_type:complete